ncbi:MAG: hypothetical protein WBE72_06435 [Terracidiphilus sp.]
MPPSPSMAGEKPGIEGRASIDATARVSEETADHQAAPAARVEAGSPDKPQAPGAKTTEGTAGAQTDTATPSGEAAPLEPAVSAEFPLAPVATSAIVLPAGIILPGIGLAPDIRDAGQAASKTAQNATPEASLSKPSNAVTAANAGKDNQTQPGAASAAASSNNLTGSNQAGPRPQTDASQAAAAAPKAADTGAPQIQAIATHSMPHEVAVSHGRAEGAGDTAHPGDEPVQAEAAESATALGINTANLIQKMNATEMRVGMHSAEFGEISIRTSVSLQQMTAQISVDHGDLGKAISAHIPDMEAKLGGQLGLRALVEVSRSGMQFSGERGYSSPGQQKSIAPAVETGGASIPVEPGNGAVPAAALAGNGYRLDIRA